MKYQILLLKSLLYHQRPIWKQTVLCVRYATKGFKGTKTCNFIGEAIILHGSSGKELPLRWGKGSVRICHELTCVHHNPARSIGDLTGIKKHFSRNNGEKKWKCDKCSKKYAVQSDWKAHQKTCGTREYKCDCGTIFSRLAKKIKIIMEEKHGSNFFFNDYGLFICMI
jgi:hypothetical protein